MLWATVSTNMNRDPIVAFGKEIVMLPAAVVLTKALPESVPLSVVLAERILLPSCAWPINGKLC
jgi:hypothetical protein